MKNILAVEKDWLLLLSGIMWSGVGLFLIGLGIKWSIKFAIIEIVPVLLFGLILGMLIARYGFKFIALKNVDRINAFTGKVCLFAFQELKSYFIILIMMSLGIFLRKSSLMPKILLSPMYIGIGSALFISSFLYYRNLIQH